MGKLTKAGDIEGLHVEPLREIADDRGAVLQMLRCDSPLLTAFGEVYFSEIKPGVIKAWKRHRSMTQHITVPVGRIRVVVYDDRPESRTNGALAEYQIGRPDSYCLLRIPPMIWYGFQGVAETASLIANCTDIPHDPKGSEVGGLDEGIVPYRW